MAIRAWSFTKFWTVSVVLWLIAAALDDVNHYWKSLGLLQAIFAFSPAFLAGSWAGTHPEIGYWPRARLIAMWTMIFLAVVAINGSTGDWGGPLVMLGAPAMIFSLRWYELTSGHPRLSSSDDPIIPPDTPPNGSLLS